MIFNGIKKRFAKEFVATKFILEFDCVILSSAVCYEINGTVKNNETFKFCLVQVFF